MIIRTRAFPRAGLIGNPSDGYFGKTIAFTFSNFAAEVALYETPDLEILPSARDHRRFESIRHLAEDVQLYGYYGGIRLLKAALKRFHDYCVQSGIQMDARNFTIRYNTDIPSHVGMAGSSAIITACFRALMAFYHVRIPEPVLANLILSVETGELGIPAGLQDRVAQVYNGMVYMDFDRATMERQGWGAYERLDVGLLPPLYIAYRTDLSEGTEVFHNNIRQRWERGEPDVIEAMKKWAELARRVRDHLVRGEKHLIGPLLDANFDLRRSIYRISDGNIRMVETARSVGASAKFCGSGGAIVGSYEGEEMFSRLKNELGRIGVEVLKPDFVPPERRSGT
jgi:glucuronokinase